MDRLEELSVIIITHNNYSQKNGCIESVVLSVLNQVEVSFEIVLVDNDSRSEDKILLEKFFDSVCKDKNVILKLNISNNISSGRNLGALSASNNVLVFMDDDVILSEPDILLNISRAYRLGKYGYSAIRKWTVPQWYEKNGSYLLESLLKNNSCLEIEIDEPDPVIRRKKDNRHLTRTYIGNFGYIGKDLFNSVGGWNEDFQGYGLEDDYMALNLYLSYGRPVILNDIYVIHIWHSLSDKDYEQLIENQKKI